MSKKSFKVIIIGLCFMLLISFGIVQPVNASGWIEKDFDPDLDLGLEEVYDSIILEDKLEIISGDVIHTKKYKIDNSTKEMVENYETTVNITDDILLLSTSDNLTEITEQVEVNLGESDNLESEYLTTAAASNPWSSGYTGKTVAKFAGHSYARNYKTNKGISRLGRLDKIVKIPSKPFD